jgi:NADH:ubiquinone oxidoreductase subunit 3 (subunit A)
MQAILTPPVAFIIYVVLVGILLVLAWRVAARGAPSQSKTSTYSSGEKAQAGLAAPGYKPFFMVALFFAILHLGVLVVGSGGFTVVTGIYILGLIFSLVALALG